MSAFERGFSKLFRKKGTSDNTDKVVERKETSPNIAKPAKALQEPNITSKQKTTRSLIKWTHPFHSNLLSIYDKHETGVFYHLVILYWIRSLKLDENKTEKGIIQIIVKYRGLIDFRFDKCSKKLGEVVKILNNGLRVVNNAQAYKYKHCVVYTSTGWSSGEYFFFQLLSA